MARDYYADGLAILDAADAAGEIYNTQWQAAKDLLNRALEAEVKESLSHYDISCRSSIYNLEQRDEKLYGITSAFCYTLHLLPSQAKKLARANKSCTCKIALSLIAVLTVVVNRWEPIAARVSAWKPLVKSGRKALSAEERKTPVRTLENTGTCGICGQNVKRTHGQTVGGLADHGFHISDRDGTCRYYGFRSGTCFGVGYQPFEVSPQAVEMYIPALHEHLVSKKKELEYIRIATEHYCIDYLIRRGEPKTLRINASDNRFDQTKNTLISNTEHKIRTIEHAIERYELAVKNWVPAQLPG